jgi:hypothetical protein
MPPPPNRCCVGSELPPRLADEGVIPLANVGAVAGFIAAAKKMRLGP